MSALTKRLAAALEAGRATRQPASPAPLPLNVQRMLMALVQGQNLDEVHTSLAALQRITKERGLGLVIVTDQSDIALFQLPDCITEFLPAPQSLTNRGGTQNPLSYVINRLGILVRKWEPVQIVPFGDAAQRLYAQWAQFAPQANRD